MNHDGQNKEKAVINEQQKQQQLDDNMQEVVQKLQDFMAEMYEMQGQTKVHIDECLEQLVEMLQGGPWPG